MQVLEAWSNFRDSINSDKTLQVYEYCLEQFLLNCDLDLESLLKLEPQQLTSLIIKYVSELRLSFQYKNQILCSIKHACEMNDVLLNWVKIKKFNKRERTDNSINGKDRPYTHKEIQQILEYADERGKCAFTLLASTGIRIGALPSMKIGDLEKMTICIRLLSMQVIMKNMLRFVRQSVLNKLIPICNIEKREAKQ